MESYLKAGAARLGDAGPPRMARYGELRAEYTALDDGPGIVDRSDRALLEVTGGDRATWLHNLTTNEVKKLSPGEGNYAFVLNVQGRILFDVNLLVRPESVLIDLDARWLSTAKSHFDKHTIMEDVKVLDRTLEFDRIAVTGDRAKETLQELGAHQALNLPWYATAAANWNNSSLLLARTDFCGGFAVDIIVPRVHAAALWQWLCDKTRTAPALPVGDDVVQVRRIESGLPWPGSEITSEVLPAETGQFSRAVSYQKGCYLGQEVVERMRSRGALARKLTGLLPEGTEPPNPGAEVLGSDKKSIGLVTSACLSIALDRPIALAYVKTSAASTGEGVSIKTESGTVAAEIRALPFVGAPVH